MPSRFLLALLIATIACVNGCSYLKYPDVHKVTIQQGNIVKPKMVDKLRPGMTRSQVRYILGTPLLMDTFDQDRWDYYYSVKRPGRKERQKKITVFFDGNTLSHFSVDSPGNDLQPAATDEVKTAETDKVKTSEADEAITAETDEANTAEADEVKTAEADEVKTAEANEAKTSEANEAKTSEADEAKTSEADEAKTSEADEAKTSEADEVKTAKADEAITAKADEAKTSEADELKTTAADEVKHGAVVEAQALPPPAKLETATPTPNQ